MKAMLKKSFYNGTMRDLTFLIGFLFLLAGFLLVPTFYEINICASFSITFMLTGFFFQIVTYLLPSPKLHRPSPSFSSSSDAYLDQAPEDFSSEEREALLQESWMVAAERFLKTRKF